MWNSQVRTLTKHWPYWFILEQGIKAVRMTMESVPQKSKRFKNEIKIQRQWMFFANVLFSVMIKILQRRWVLFAAMWDGAGARTRDKDTCLWNNFDDTLYWSNGIQLELKTIHSHRKAMVETMAFMCGSWHQKWTWTRPVFYQEHQFQSGTGSNGG